MGGVGTGWGHITTTTILKGNKKKPIITTERIGWKGWINAYTILL